MATGSQAPLTAPGAAITPDKGVQQERLFPKLTESQIERVARCGKRRSVPAGAVLFEQGQRNRELFVML